MPDFSDFPGDAKAPTTKAPAANVAPSAPVSQNKIPIAIRDWQGEEWPMNSARGRQEESTALANGTKPDYVYEASATSPSALPNAPAQKAPTQKPTTQQSATPSNGGFYQQGLAPVKAMQQAMINLSKDIASHSIQSVQDRHSEGDEGSRTLLNGANSFMNFMVSNYMNKAKTTGKQLVSGDIGQPVHMDASKTNDNFKGILDTIQRIGSSGTKSADGDWGARTNNALQQVYSLAHALMGIVNDMGLHLTGYSEGDLQELYAAIPQDIAKDSLNDKVEKAGVIAKNLDKLRGLYDSFRETILNNPNYAAQISQEKPLTVSKVKKAPEEALNANEKALYEQHKSTELNITLNGRQVSIMPFNLTSMDNFKKFLNSKKDALSPEELIAVNKGDNQTINKLLSEVSTGLEQ